MSQNSHAKKRLGCRTWLLIVLAVIILGAIIAPKNQTATAPTPSPTHPERSPVGTESKDVGEGLALPPHTVAKDTVIANGRRIEIHVTTPGLTKDECRALLAAYRDKAAPAGQVSVRKPDKTGELLPWCVDNLGGSPIIFNDDFFKETSGKVDITIEVTSAQRETATKVLTYTPIPDTLTPTKIKSTGTRPATRAPTRTQIPTIFIAPTDTPLSAVNPPGQACCKICRSGKACGDSCIARDKTCTKPPGCACNG